MRLQHCAVNFLQFYPSSSCIGQSPGKMGYSVLYLYWLLTCNDPQPTVSSMHYKILSATPPGEHSARSHLRLPREQHPHQSLTDTSPIVRCTATLWVARTDLNRHHQQSALWLITTLHHTCPSHVKLPPGTTACGTRSPTPSLTDFKKKKKKSSKKKKIIMLMTMMRMVEKGMWLRHNSPTPPFSPTCFTLYD